MKQTQRPARAAPPSRSGGGFMLGLFLGLILGLAIALGVAFYLNKTPIPFLGKSEKPAAKDAKEAPAEAKPMAGMPQGAAKGEKPKFDFYKILPGSEEPVTEKEVKEAAKAGKDAEPARGVFFLQAGAFQNPSDADNQKAKIALLGLESSVEPTTLPDKGTWYRVRLGPYSSLEDVNRARRVLSQNGVDASLVKVRDAAAKTNP